MKRDELGTSSKRGQRQGYKEPKSNNKPVFPLQSGCLIGPQLVDIQPQSDHGSCKTPRPSIHAAEHSSLGNGVGELAWGIGLGKCLVRLTGPWLVAFSSDPDDSMT